MQYRLRQKQMEIDAMQIAKIENLNELEARKSNSGQHVLVFVPCLFGAKAYTYYYVRVLYLLRGIGLSRMEAAIASHKSGFSD